VDKNWTSERSGLKVWVRFIEIGQELIKVIAREPPGVALAELIRLEAYSFGRTDFNKRGPRT
jgi:hypothetical protein